MEDGYSFEPQKSLVFLRGYINGCFIFPEILNDKNYYSIIFSHSFAKAFFGTEEIEVTIRSQLRKDLDEFTPSMKMHKWQYHLQKMVLELEPLKYLEKFL